ncbi:type III restriction-modification enzyme domain protein [Helicobacter pylori UM038]|uniref:Type III restriction-modification enzyme domain protein n=1 Tax=Helicobacter pylori UM038 TaxID=1352343 RepID=A0AAV3JT29_HELPX|nr:type III restriction-modification enzyme domain protein [Helicobacter pylori UM038]
MIFIQLFAYTLKINLKTLRYNFLTFSLRDFMQDLFTQSYPPPPISNKRSRTQ